MHKGEGIKTGSFTYATPKIAVGRSGSGDNDDDGHGDSKASAHSDLGWAKIKHNPTDGGNK